MHPYMSLEFFSWGLLKFVLTKCVLIFGVGTNRYPRRDLPGFILIYLSALTLRMGQENALWGCLFFFFLRLSDDDPSSLGLGEPDVEFGCWMVQLLILTLALSLFIKCLNIRSAVLLIAHLAKPQLLSVMALKATPPWNSPGTVPQFKIISDRGPLGYSIRVITDYANFLIHLKNLWVLSKATYVSAARSFLFFCSILAFASSSIHGIATSVQSFFCLIAQRCCSCFSVYQCFFVCKFCKSGYPFLVNMSCYAHLGDGEKFDKFRDNMCRFSKQNGRTSRPYIYIYGSEATTI